MQRGVDGLVGAQRLVVVKRDPEPEILSPLWCRKMLVFYFVGQAIFFFHVLSVATYREGAATVECLADRATGDGVRVAV